MPNHPDEKGDEDDGQHHPKSYVGVQQQLRLRHAAWQLSWNTQRADTRLTRIYSRLKHSDNAPNKPA